MEIPPGTYTLSIAGIGEDAAATGDLDINANMTIQGIDPATTIIDANQIDRVFHITGNYTVNVNNLTIRNGRTRYVSGSNYEGDGGGFFVFAGTLNLVNDIITSNSATSGGGIGTDGAASKVINIANTTLSNNLNFLDQLGEGGGAIYAYNTILSLTDSIITANIGHAGGIYSYAPILTITRTLFSDNNGTGLYGGGNITVTDSTFLNNDAGGIINFGNLIVTGSTFTGNTALSNGGAIYAWRGTAQIKNSTFSGNSAVKGGAIYNADATDVGQGTSNATITNSTFYGNTATSGNGSGVYSDADGTVTLRANIFSNGSGSTCTVNTGGTLTSSGYNLSDNGTCATYFTNTGDQNNVNPLLGALQNNGGNTFTHALQTGSPAIDAIPTGNCTLATDQRGTTRPQGAACDSGAYEVDLGPLQTGPTFTVNVLNDNNDSCTTLDCSLREAITAANADSDTNTITFSITGSGVHTIQPATPLPLITNPVIIDGTTQTGYAVGAPVIELNGANAVNPNPITHVGINMVGASNSIVRGLVINGWSYSGVGILGGSNNAIEGNFIGTNASGTAAVPNLYGVIIYNGSNNRVGGTTAAQRNVIAGNNDDGVNIGGAASAQAVANIVQGNYVGTTAAGTAPLGNGDDGVKVEIANGTIIGGTTASARNIIAASVHNGVILKGVDTVFSLVQGNYIGTDVTGTVALGNGLAGVRIEDAPNNIVGGTVAGAGNVITANQGGITVLNATATGNRIYGNSIFSNLGLGIDLGNIDGVTPNDLGDADTGPNNLQNFPVLSAATIHGSTLSIEGSLNSGATPEYWLEFFANASCDPSGYGEGQTYLGFARFQTGVNHDLNFSVSLPVSVPAGQFVTATATLSGTSEFSACVQVTQGSSDSSQPGPTFTVNTTTDSNDGMCGVNTCSLRDAIIAANANSNTNTIAFNIAPSGAATIQPTSELPVITYPVVIDGTNQPGYAGTPIIELDGTLVGSSKNGLTIDGGNSTVRGLVINRFAQYGILIETNGGNTIQGNYIGTDITGNIARGNGYASLSVGVGIFVTSGSNLFGGVTSAARNVISGNTANGGAGIGLFGSDASSNTIQGNYIGTNASGTAALGNYDGVVMNGGNSTVGGTIPAARNIISGNTVGVYILTANNVIQGNYIGTDVTGLLNVGNTDAGIQFLGASIVSGNNNRIGGTVPGAGNIIAFNGTQGIQIDNPTALSGEAILGNAIFSNGALGIDLAPLGINSNDVGDVDTGMNNRQNFPVISSANSIGGVTTISGTLNSETNKTYRVEFFANPTCDSSGNGEGKTYLGFTNVTTIGTTGSFSFNMPTANVNGDFITATATDPNYNTSEFSACVPVVAVSLPAAAPIPTYYRTTTVPLTWTGVTWAIGYEIQVDDNADFMTLAYSSSLGADVRSDIANLLSVDAIYYWRVGAKKSGGVVVWSAPQKFTVDVP
ncbi:MAG: choice-of-anchor Q domain-containing protein [Chloroflexota bacterium]